MRGPPGRGAGGGAVYDRPRLGAPVPGPRPGAGCRFAALAVELGGEAVTPPAGADRFALTAITAAFGAAAGLPGWLAAGLWRFASAVSGGRLIAANTGSPFLVVGKRRFMPPVPSAPS